MNCIVPKPFYKGLPCSVVSIGCASELLRGTFDYDKIKMFSEMASRNNNYATLRSVNEQVRKFFNVKRYTYYTREQRKKLKEYHFENAIVCVYGHFVFVHGDTYYSFFDNDDDRVVAVWELV